MAPKLSDRLQQASERLFVGRASQCQLFEEALKSEILPFLMLHIYGPGGIGKTTLLYELKRRCDGLNVPTFYVDTRTIEAEPVSFIEELSRVLGIRSGEKPEEMLGASGRCVLMLDTFESMFSLEQWLYTSFFPELADNVLIVIAGRFPPSTTWTDNPGWKAVINEAPLRNLSPGESRQYLAKAGVREKLHQAAIDYTHGHPLALSLVAQSLEAGDQSTFEGELEPDFIKVLLDRFVREVPRVEYRQALEACVLVNHLTEPLLARMLDASDVRELFNWLRGLSFIESGSRGVFPHDIAREVLGAELKWRNPAFHETLNRRARVYYNEQLHEAGPERQGNILKDYIFLHRDHAIVKPFFTQLQTQWAGGAPAVSTDRYRDSDLDDLEALVMQHEGADSAALARMWVQAQPENVIVFRNPKGEVEGFLLMLALHAAPADRLKRDPISRDCLAHLNETGPLRPGEAATLFRFWMDAGSYQNISQVQSLIFVHMVRHYLTMPGLAYSMVPISNPAFWKPVFVYADLDYLESLDYVVNGRQYGVFGHDWRRRPPAAWLDVLASRESGGTMLVETEETSRRPVLVLSEEAFGDAVRKVLRNYTRTDRLVKNPLLSSRLVADNVSEDAEDDERIVVLINLLNEAIEIIANNPRQSKLYRALDRTYLRPAASQEQAAELLDLPYSTFRRHLAAGVAEITDLLWQQELGGVTGRLGTETHEH